MIVATSKQKIKKNDVPISLFQKSCHTWTDKKKKKKNGYKAAERQAGSPHFAGNTNGSPGSPRISILFHPPQTPRANTFGFARLNEREIEEEEEEEEERELYRGFRGIEAFGDQVCPSVHGLVRLRCCKPIIPAAARVLVHPTPSPPSVRRERGHVRRQALEFSTKLEEEHYHLVLSRNKKAMLPRFIPFLDSWNGFPGRAIRILRRKKDLHFCSSNSLSFTDIFLARKCEFERCRAYS